MDTIWKINPKYYNNINREDKKFFDSIYLCSHCCSRIHSIGFRKLLVKEDNPDYNKKNNYNDCSESYKQPKTYTICFICKRYIQGIQNGPDIIKFIDNSIKNSDIPECESSLCLQLGKISTWYFHDIYDDFGHYLKKRYNFNHQQLKNIYQSIYELYGLPSIETINDRANYLKIMIKYNITGRTWPNLV